MYHNGMIPSSQKVMNLIMSYLEEKKGKPFDLAVDVGCGTGRYTRPLAAYFQKVIGIDISESQINVWLKCQNVHVNVAIAPFILGVSSADNMPLKDASVDLNNTGIAAHWFDINKFIQEAARVLKQGGCLALHSFLPIFEIHYKDISGTLTNIIGEAFDIIFKYGDKSDNVIRSQYQKILESIPFTTKTR
ncbi:putative methyltransferase [Rhinophrynus dorsalis]